VSVLTGLSEGVKMRTTIPSLPPTRSMNATAILPSDKRVTAGENWSPELNRLSLTSPPTLLPAASYLCPTTALPRGLCVRLPSSQTTT
jgi:hypothetical protein